MRFYVLDFVIQHPEISKILFKYVKQLNVKAEEEIYMYSIHHTPKKKGTSNALEFVDNSKIIKLISLHTSCVSISNIFFLIKKKGINSVNILNTTSQPFK